jgi:hypothetical protein
MRRRVALATDLQASIASPNRWLPRRGHPYVRDARRTDEVNANASALTDAMGA